MHRTLLSLLLLAACSGGPVDPDLQAALDAAVFPEGGSEADTWVYRVAELDPGAIVAPLLDGEPVEATEPTTLFLVDPLPDAGWSKPVQWVYVDADGDVHLQDADWFPVVDGVAFDPAHHDAEWGIGGEATADLPALTDLDDGSTARRPPPAAEDDGDPCTPEKTDVALTIAAWDQRDVRSDELNMSLMLGHRHDFELTRVKAKQPATTIEQKIQSALAEYASRPEGSIDELVIYYAGHGAKGSGTWVIGSSDTGTTTVTIAELALWIAPVPADRLTIISDSCFSGALAATFETTLRQHDDADDMEVRFIHAASPDQFSWGTGTGRGGQFTFPFVYDSLLPLPTDQDIDWDAVPLPGPFTIHHKGKAYPQTPGRRFSEPGPLFTEPFVPEGDALDAAECVDGYLDAQTYDRELRLAGAWFGDEEGHVSARNVDGQWIDLDVVYWADTDLILHMPMRTDGFPSDGHSPDLEDPQDGRYAVRVERADDYAVSPHDAIVEVTLQSYAISWTPDYSEYDHPDYNEMWHPLTPVSSWTDGPTIQLSALYDADNDLEPEPELSDIPVLHQTTPTVQGTPYWGYDLFPAVRDLDTAYEQGFPDFQYYGFRQDFGEDFTFDLTWTYVLAYD